MGGYVASPSGFIGIGLKPVMTLMFLIQQQMVAIPQSRDHAGPVTAALASHVLVRHVGPQRTRCFTRPKAVSSPPQRRLCAIV